MDRYPSDATYTEADLSSWQFDGVSLAVLGYPVRHSISPQMHNAALEQMARSDPSFARWRYFRFEIQPENLPQLLPLFWEKGFFGLNLTVPHKTIAIDHIAETDSNARSIGAVNTLKRQENGYSGYNTDGYGLDSGIRNAFSIGIENKDVLLIGAGGASRAAAAQCLQSKCKSLAILNRNQERLNALISDLRPIIEESQIPVRPLSPKSDFSIPSDALIINATSLGLKADDPLPIAAHMLSDSTYLYDMIYSPEETKLMRATRTLGGQAANGLSMLVYQGAKSLEIWSESNPSEQAMFSAAEAAMASSNR